ncbi:hypothetical protein VAEU17_4360104 [Vibrio aestuarianus]|nr:hypothetical protein VAEU17_4360104 [Vibrio aestuarianus]CAH8237553.1 hypothetical protein VAEKB19_5200058 [Vibrio aestuarianus]
MSPNSRWSVKNIWKRFHDGVGIFASMEEVFVGNGIFIVKFRLLGSVDVVCYGVNFESFIVDMERYYTKAG